MITKRMKYKVVIPCSIDLIIKIRENVNQFIWKFHINTSSLISTFTSNVTINYMFSLTSQTLFDAMKQLEYFNALLCEYWAKSTMRSFLNCVFILLQQVILLVLFPEYILYAKEWKIWFGILDQKYNFIFLVHYRNRKPVFPFLSRW